MKNGVEGHGPFGFQPELFSSVSGDEDYSPLSHIHLVRWKEDTGTPVHLHTIDPRIDFDLLPEPTPE